MQGQSIRNPYELPPLVAMIWFTELFDLACRALKSDGREKSSTPADSKSFSEMPPLDIGCMLSLHGKPMCKFLYFAGTVILE